MSHAIRRLTERLLNVLYAFSLYLASQWVPFGNSVHLFRVNLPLHFNIFQYSAADKKIDQSV